MNKPRIGFIGVGMMGHGMAKNLVMKGFATSTFDVNKHIEPKHILNVMEKHPELFADLPPIPPEVRIGKDFVFKP